MSKITLDAETFKALASTTRLAVLRALDVRRKTLTELARDLELNKATLHEHLHLLTAADLVRKRDDEGRKWIYYELTWQGQRLLHPQETTTFNVLLGLGVAAAGGGVTLLGRALGWWLQEKAPEVMFTPSGLAPEAQDNGTGSGTQTGTTSSTMADGPEASTMKVAQDAQHDFWDDGGLALALVAASALFGFLAWQLRKKFRPKAFVPPTDVEAPGA